MDVAVGVIRSGGRRARDLTPFYKDPFWGRFSSPAQAYDFGRNRTVNGFHYTHPEYFGWIGVREMRADVAEPGRAEQRVADRVGQRVTVGVSHRAQMKWEFDTAEDEFAAFGEAMKIVSDTRPGHRAARSSRR